MNPYSQLPNIYDAALSRRNWVTALDQVAEGTFAKGVMLFAINQSGIDYAVQTSNSLYANREDDIQKYVEKFSHYDEQAISHLLASQPHIPILDTDMWPDLEILRSREDIVFTREALGIFRRVSFNLSNSPEFNAGIILQYDSAEESAQPEDIENAMALMPHMTKVLEINRFFSQLRQKYDAVLSVLDHVDVGICVTSEYGDILICNERAKQILVDEDGIWRDRSGKIHFSNDKTHIAVSDHILKCSKTAAGKNGTTEYTALAPRRSGRDSYLVEVSPLRDGDGEFEKNLSGAMILIIDPESAPENSPKPLAKIYGLTDAETQIAGFLLQGKTTGQIAEIRNTSPDTVKNQCKAIYAKTGVTSRAQLIRTMVALSPPII